MKRKQEKAASTNGESSLMAEAAFGRGAMYELLLDVFVGLPDRALVSEIGGARFEDLPSACGKLGVQRLDDGAVLVAVYRTRLGTEDPEKVLNELSVDRTRLLRATGNSDLRPPYERLYTPGVARGSVFFTELGDFYRKAGLSLSQGAGEAHDFLFVELDFMKEMCVREAEAWLHGTEGPALQALELRFLNLHPGRWAAAYCAEAERHARTDFYRGFLAVLDGFLESERTHLGEPDSFPDGGRPEDGPRTGPMVPAGFGPHQ